MIDAIQSPQLHLLLDHYLEIRGGRRMPARRDIDATRLGPVLPIIWLSEFEPAAGTFRYRLAGEEVNEVFGRSVAGRLLSDFVFDDRFDATNENFLKVLREEAALLTNGPIYRCADRIAVGERLVLPLASDGVTADGLLGATARSDSVDLDSVSLAEQTITFIPVDALNGVAAKRTAGDD